MKKSGRIEKHSEIDGSYEKGPEKKQREWLHMGK